MKINIGFDIIYTCSQPTPMVLMLNIHPSRVADIIEPDVLHFNPDVLKTTYFDGFGNVCTRVVAPAGPFHISTSAIVLDSGLPDPQNPMAEETPVPVLPNEVLVYLLASRYCETDRLAPFAWSLFGNVTPGWSRVRAIVEFVHNTIEFGYHHANPTKSAFDVLQQRRGVCRDFAHLAIALCRCMNIPARYATGYLGDIGVVRDAAPMDFSAWFEAYLGDQWYTFDARHNTPRIGRVLMAYGRDAADVALTTSIGEVILTQFNVWTIQLPENASSPSFV